MPEQLISVAVWTKMWVNSNSLVEVVGLNPVGGMDVCLLRVLCVVKAEVCNKPITYPEDGYQVCNV